jgi:hypothetical protein
MGACCSCQAKDSEQLPPTPLPHPPSVDYCPDIDDCPSIIFHDSYSNTSYDYEHPSHQSHNSSCELMTTTLPATTSSAETTQFCLTLVTPTKIHPSSLQL